MDAQHVSRLTARWIENLPGEESTVVSGLGIRPLLALLAELADEPARSELAEAAGGPSDGLLQVIDSMSPVPSVVLSLPYFEVDAEHDLLEHPAVFGLTAASDNSRGHFPGLSAYPLAVDQAKQAVTARFSATGFEAAAVTAMAMAAGSAPMPGGKALRVSLDEPFGFIVVHRPTGIPVVAGWVNYW